MCSMRVCVCACLIWAKSCASAWLNSPSIRESQIINFFLFLLVLSLSFSNNFAFLEEFFQLPLSLPLPLSLSFSVSFSLSSLSLDSHLNTPKPDQMNWFDYLIPSFEAPSCRRSVDIPGQRLEILVARHSGALPCFQARWQVRKKALRANARILILSGGCCDSST